eukprot:s275_g25.t1
MWANCEIMTVLGEAVRERRAPDTAIDPFESNTSMPVETGFKKYRGHQGDGQDEVTDLDLCLGHVESSSSWAECPNASPGKVVLADKALLTMPEFQVSDGEDTAESWGEPIKVEASSPLPNSKVSGSPTLSPITPVNLELPVKLLRLDHSPVQMTQYEEEEEEDEEQEQTEYDSPDQETSFTSPEWMFNHGSASDLDVWSGLAEWNSWLAMKMEMSYGGEQFEGPHPAPEQISQGSALHGTGACKPCAWFWKPGSCQNKDNCSYCHLCPEGELKARKKAKVAMMRLGVITPKTAKENPETVLNLSSLL